MKVIKLTQNKATLVDDEDYKWLSQWRWYYNKHGNRAMRNTCVNENEQMCINNSTTIFMHREIMKCPKGKVVDHIDGNPLNNQKSNLRVCSQGENSRNRIKKFGNNRFKGVRWDKECKKWRAHIWIGYVNTYLGMFCNEIDAAVAYNEAAVKYHKEFAKLNNINQNK